MALLVARPGGPDYVLQPLSGSARVRFDKSAGESPKFEARVELPDVRLSVSDAQAATLGAVQARLQHSATATRYSHLGRPCAPVAQDARGWWAYAVRCVRSELARKHVRISAAALMARRDTRRKYIALYSAQPKSPEALERIEELEDELSVADIVLYRSLADADLLRKQSQQSGLLARFFGTASSSASTYLSTLTPEQKEMLYNTIEYTPDMARTAPLPDTTLAKMSLTLHSGSFTVMRAAQKQQDARPLASAAFTNLRVAATLRPTSYAIAASLESLRVTDPGAAAGSGGNILQARECTAEPLFEMNFEKCVPGRSEYAYDLRLSTRNIDVVINRRWITDLRTALKPLRLLEKGELVAHGYTRHLRQALARAYGRSRVNAQIHIEAPRVIVPSSASSFENGDPFLVVDLGQLSLVAVPECPPQFLDDCARKNRDLYDNYRLEMSHIQVLAGEMTNAESSQPTCAIVEPLSLEWVVQVCSAPLNQDFPKMRILGHLDRLSATLDAFRLKTLFHAAEHFAVGDAQEQPQLQQQQQQQQQQQPPRDRDPGAAVDDTEAVLDIFAPADPKAREAEVNLTVDAVHVAVGRTQTEPIAQAELGGLSMGLATRPHDTQLRFKLVSVAVEDLMPRPEPRPADEGARGLAPVAVAQSDSLVGQQMADHPLIMLNVLFCTPKSPLMKDVPVKVDLAFNTLRLWLQHRIVSALYALFFESSAKLRRSKSERRIPRLPSVSSEDHAGESSPWENAVNHVTVHVAAVEVNMVDEALMIVGRAQLTNSAIVVTQYAAAAKIKVIVDAVEIHDTREPQDRLVFSMRSVGSNTPIVAIDKAGGHISAARIRLGHVLSISALSFWGRYISMVLALARIFPSNAFPLIRSVEVYIPSTCAVLPCTDEYGKCFMLRSSDFYLFSKLATVANAAGGGARSRVLSLTGSATLSAYHAEHNGAETQLVQSTGLEITVEHPTAVAATGTAPSPATKIGLVIKETGVVVTQKHILGLCAALTRAVGSFLTDLDASRATRALSSAASSAAGNRSLALSWRFKSATVQLLHGEAEAPDIPPSPFARIDLRDLVLALYKGTDTKALVSACGLRALTAPPPPQMGITLGSAKAFDMRGDMKEMMTLAPPEGTTAEPSAVLWYQKKKLAPSSLTVHVSDLCMSVYLGFLYDSVEFLLNAASNVVGVLSPRWRAVRNAVAPQGLVTVIPPERKSDLDVSISLAKFCISAHRSATQGPLLFVKYYKKERGREAQVLLDGFSLSCYDQENKNSFSQILQPMKISAVLSRAASSSDVGVQVTLGPVRLTFAYQDFLFMQDAFDKISQQRLQDIYARYESLVASSAPEPARRASPSITVLSCGLRALLLNDRAARRVPLLKFRLTSFDANVHFMEKTLMAAVKAELKADFYNLVKAAWEPLVEPWDVHVEVSRTGGAEKQTRLSVSSPTRLDINVTKHFVEMVEVLLAMLRSGSAGQPPAQSAPFRPLLFRNVTGKQLSYAVSAEGPMVSVSPGAETPIEIPNLQTSSATDASTMAIHLQGYNPVTGISFEKIKSTEMTLTSSIDEDDASVIFDVSYKEGSKVVSLLSSVLVENKATIPVQFRVQRGQRVVFQSPHIEPDKQFGVPPSCTHASDNYALSLAFPSLESDTWVSIPFEIGHFPPGTRLVSLRIGQAFFANAHITRTRPNQGHANTCVIKILPTVVIENLLASTMTFRLSSAGKCVSQAALDSGDSCQSFGVPCDQTAELYIQIAGFAWSLPAALVSEACHRTIKLTDDRERTLLLDADIAYGEDQVKRVCVYSKYWLVDATGLNMTFFTVSSNGKKSIAPGQHPLRPEEVPDIAQDPLLWYKKGEPNLVHFCPDESFPELQIRGTAVQIPVSGVSKAFDVETLGMVREISVKERKRVGAPKRKLFSFGVSIKSAPGRFVRTKVAVFLPRFVLNNQLPREIYYKQCGQDMESVWMLPPSAQVPLHWPDKDGTMLLTLSGERTADTTCWSGGFSLHEIGRFCMRVPLSGARHQPAAAGGEAAAAEFVWVDIAMSESSLVVTLAPATRSTPPAYRVENETPFAVMVRQAQVGTSVTVQPGAALQYAWDEPTRPNRRLEADVLCRPRVASFAKPLNIDKIGSRKAAELPLPEEADGHAAVQALVYVDGPVKVLRFFVGDAAAAPAVDAAPPRSAPLAAVLAVPGRGGVHAYDLNLAGVGVSLVNAAPQELLYATLSNISCAVVDSAEETTLRLDVDRVQVDNQLHVTQYPVLLCAAERAPSAAPAESSSSSSAAAAPDQQVFRMSVVRSKQVSQDVVLFKYFAVLVRELVLCVDETLLNRLLEFLMSIAPESAAVPLTFDVLESPGAGGVAGNRMVYFELLHLNPVKVQFSFSPGVDEAPDSPGALANPLRQLLGGLSLMGVEAAPLTLSALMLEHPFFPMHQLLLTIRRYYENQVLQQLYGLVLGLDILGAPLMLWNFCGKGLCDFFYEPAIGLIKSPEEFARGLSKGTQSFVRNNVVGIFNSGSKLLGSLGKIALMSLDGDYQRGHCLATKDPKHVGEGLLFGAKDFGKGVFRGFTGVVTEPIKGAQREGLQGLIKGLGKGVVGVAMKPTVGVLDLATQTAKGIRNTATYFDAKAARVRNPRYLSPGGALLPYDAHLSLGQTLLWTLSKGKFRGEQYVFHAEVPAMQRVVLVSRAHLFVLHMPQPLGPDAAGLPSFASDPAAAQVDWMAAIRDVARVERSPGEVRCILTGRAVGVRGRVRVLPLRDSPEELLERAAGILASLVAECQAAASSAPQL
eukprot:m51a1_g1072 hypothetical protein (2769) ;mRNA; r:855370-865973